MLRNASEKYIKYVAQEFFDSLSSYVRGSLDEYLTPSELKELEENIEFVLSNIVKYI